MPIEQGKGDLLKADVEALVNPVNTRGVMGAGLALQFKKAFPDNFTAYEQACKAGGVVIGRIHIVERVMPPRFIINFPTKDHWRHPSKFEYIQDGLIDLIAQVHKLGIQSIAIPALGCGKGGLDWAIVKPLIVQVFSGLSGVRVIVFDP